MSTRWLCVVLLAGIAFGTTGPTGAGEAAPAASPFAKDVAEALGIGFRPGGANAEAADEILNRVAREAPDDPRVHFAAGLIWLKQIQSRKAEAAFEKAVRCPGAAYWPAWRGWIWVAARSKAVPAVVERMNALVAKVMEQPDAAGAGDQLVWCGRVFAALRRVETSRASLKLLTEADEQRRAKLDPVLAERFDTGRAELERAVEEETEKAAGAAAKQLEKKQADAAVEESRVDGSLEKAAAAKADSQRSQQQWKNWLDEQLKTLDKELAGLEKDFAFLSQRRSSVQESISSVQREMTQLELSRGVTNRNMPPTTANSRTAIQGRIDRCANQLQLYQLELAATEEQMLLTVGAGNATVVRRREVVAKYEQATGRLADKQAHADRWAGRLTVKKNQVKANVAKAEQRQVAAPRMSLSALVPFDVAEQRRALEMDLSGKR